MRRGELAKCPMPPFPDLVGRKDGVRLVVELARHARPVVANCHLSVVLHPQFADNNVVDGCVDLSGE